MTGIVWQSLIVALVVSVIVGIINSLLPPHRYVRPIPHRPTGRADAKDLRPPVGGGTGIFRPFLLLGERRSTGALKASNLSNSLPVERILLEVRQALYPLYEDAKAVETIAIAQRAAEELETRRLQMMGHQGLELTEAQEELLKIREICVPFMAAGDIPGITTCYMVENAIKCGNSSDGYSVGFINGLAQGKEKAQKEIDDYRGLAAANLETARAAQDMLDEIRSICCPLVREPEKYGTAELVREALKAVQRGHKENCEALLAIRKTCVPLFKDGSCFTTVGLVEKLVEERDAYRRDFQAELDGAKEIRKHLVAANAALSGHDDNGRGFTMLGLAEAVDILAKRSAEELKELRLGAEPVSDFTRACLSRARRRFEELMADEPEAAISGLHEDRIVALVERLRRELAETRKHLEGARAIRQTIREICEPLVEDTRCETVELVRRVIRAAYPLRVMSEGVMADAQKEVR